MPVVGSHVPATWHWSSAVQAVLSVAWQVPPWQAAAKVHAFPSVHDVPSVPGVVLQT